MGQRNRLSSIDIAKINTLYKCSTTTAANNNNYNSYYKNYDNYYKNYYPKQNPPQTKYSQNYYPQQPRG